MAGAEASGRETVVLPGVDRYRVKEPLFEGVRVLLSHRGKPYSPAYVQGIAGAAFRVSGPCPCAPTVGRAMEPPALIRLLGYEPEVLLISGDGLDPARDIVAVIDRVKEEIRRGRPALVWNAFTLAEWDVVCGYDDSAGTFLGRGSYVGLDGYASEPQSRAATGVATVPILGVITVGERTGRFDAGAAEVAALQEAVRHARTPEDRLAVIELGTAVSWRFRNGLGCYDWWINSFIAEPLRVAPSGERYCLGVFRSTHAAAADFLREIAARHHEAEAPLLQAADAFAAEAAALAACADALFPGWQVPQTGDADRSAEAVGLLTEARLHYADAIDALEAALGCMGAGPEEAPSEGDTACGPGCWRTTTDSQR